MRVEVIVFILAIVWSLISKLLRYRHDRLAKFEEHPTIFVALVSFCDPAWFGQVQHLMDTAEHPRRVNIGVIEFVDRAEDTQITKLPSEWRHSVRVYTVARVIADSQRLARKLCFDETYNEEAYVLFTNGWTALHAWDTTLVKMVAGRKVVLSTQLTPKGSAAFPVIVPSTRAIQRRKLRVHSPNPIPSLIWQSDFTFAPANAATHVLSSSDEYEVSQALVEHGFAICVPGVRIGASNPSPRGIKSARKKQHGAARFAASIGVHADGVSPSAALGLHEKRTADECIAKYGSVTAARIAYQTEKHSAARTSA